MLLNLLRHPSVLIAALALVADAAGARELLDSDDAIVNTGYTLYHTHCATCHGSDAGGAAVEGPASSTRSTDLTTLAARNGGTFPFWELYEVISGTELLPAHGTRHMPIWGEQLRESPGTGTQDANAIVRGRILAIMAYLATVQKP